MLELRHKYLMKKKEFVVYESNVLDIVAAWFRKVWHPRGGGLHR